MSGFSGSVSSIAGNTGAFALGNGLTNSANILLADPVFFRSYLAGLTLSTAGASTSFTTAAGVAVDGTNAGFMILTVGIVKTTGAWAAGSGSGGIDTGSIANSTWYHVYLMKRPDIGVIEVSFSTSASAPTTGGNIPVAYTLFRRIGSMKTNGSAQWTKFIQDGDTFQWDVAVVDVNGAVNPGTAAVTRTLSTPLGVRVQAFVNVNALLSTTASVDNPAAVLLSDLSISDQAPNVTGVLSFINYSGGTQVGGTGYVMTNTASQIRSRLAQSTANTSLYIATQAWVDRRGRD